MADWIGHARAACSAGPTALITVLATEGSAPRGAGTRMVVTADAQHGTIGGGQLEFRAVDQARAMLSLLPGTWRIQDYPLGPLLGQCCGGRVRLLVEHLAPDALGWLEDVAPGHTLASRLQAGGISRTISEAPPQPQPARGPRPDVGATLLERIGVHRRPLYLFGAGHVGQAIARAVAPLPFSLAWFDSRAELQAIAGVIHVAADTLPDCAAGSPANAAILILTHDHGLDYRLTAAALRTSAPFVGLIGSATKRARFLSRLAADGVAAGRLTCPIGMPGIPGKAPEEIAVATVAQLLTLPRPD